MRPFDKPALSVEQQLELLKQRGLQVANDERAMRFLEVVTLFRLSPYMRPFQETNPEHTFKPGSTLKAVVDIYRFDGSLRRITMDAIERVEVAIRAAISNHMCPKYGPDWIADASIFSSSYSHGDLLRPLRDQLGKERNKLGREIDRIKKSSRADQVQQQRIENRMRDNYFRFYGSTYSHPELPPAWAVLEELSLGTVSTMRRQERDREQIQSPLRSTGLLAPHSDLHSKLLRPPLTAMEQRALDSTILTKRMGHPKCAWRSASTQAAAIYSANDAGVFNRFDQSRQPVEISLGRNNGPEGTG